MLYNMFYKILYRLRGFRFMLYSILFLSVIGFNLCSVEIVQRLNIKTKGMIQTKKGFSVKELYSYSLVGKTHYYTFRVKCPNCRAENKTVKDNLYDMAALHFEFTGNNNLIPIIDALHVTEIAYNAETNYYRVRGYVELTNGRKSLVFTFQRAKL